MAEILFERVEKIFGGTRVIKGLDLCIRDGEFFTFVGPSGCGKSTILNIIAGLEDATGGAIRFDGREVNDLSPKERDVAMVFQSYALYPHMNVFENMAFPLRMKKTSGDVTEAEVNRVASMLGLEGLLKRKPRELSGGQRQRVALGRAIIRKPRVFLMDEPLSNLDARLRVEMRAELKKLHEKLRITTIYVTHDQAEAMSMSDRIAVVFNGEVQQCGVPNDIYRKPVNTMVAGFVGSPPMNFINVTLKGRDPAEIDCEGVIVSPGTDGSPENDDVVLGVRPEDVTVSSYKEKGSFGAVVSFVESAGPFNWAGVKWRDALVRGVAEIDEKLKTGDRCFISFQPGRAVLFDKETGRRI